MHREAADDPQSLRRRVPRTQTLKTTITRLRNIDSVFDAFRITPGSSWSAVLRCSTSRPSRALGARPTSAPSSTASRTCSTRSGEAARGGRALHQTTEGARPPCRGDGGGRPTVAGAHRGAHAPVRQLAALLALAAPVEAVEREVEAGCAGSSTGRRRGGAGAGRRRRCRSRHHRQRPRPDLEARLGDVADVVAVDLQRSGRPVCGRHGHAAAPAKPRRGGGGRRPRA